METELNIDQLGFLYSISAGFQFDLNTALKQTPKGYFEAHLCDHNCSQDCGNYACPAAFSLNHGVNPSTMLTFDEITGSLTHAQSGLKLMNKTFMARFIDKYCQEWHIPPAIKARIKATYAHNKFELNMFGGNPELHPDFFRIITWAQQAGWRVTTTTTGKKFLYDVNFTNAFLRHPPDLLAMSADDYEDLDELTQVLTMELSTIKNYWQKANPLYGQRKKALESIYVAKLAQTTTGFPQILFNIVVHPGNLAQISQMLKIFSQSFPSIILNPYPAQSSFELGSNVWRVELLELLEQFVDSMIARQLDQVGAPYKCFVPRLPYWLTLKSVFNTYGHSQLTAQMMSGVDTWQCFRNPGSGRYLQASSSQQQCDKNTKVGAHPGCFWHNHTVTISDQVIYHMNAQQISDYLLTVKPELGQNTKDGCPGCIMPRLMFDGPTIELGLAPHLKPAYLKLRQQYFKF